MCQMLSTFSASDSKNENFLILKLVVFHLIEYFEILNYRCSWGSKGDLHY